MLSMLVIFTGSTEVTFFSKSVMPSCSEAYELRSLPAPWENKYSWFLCLIVSSIFFLLYSNDPLALSYPLTITSYLSIPNFLISEILG